MPVGRAPWAAANSENLPAPEPRSATTSPVPSRSIFAIMSNFTRADSSGGASLTPRRSWNSWSS